MTLDIAFIFPGQGSQYVGMGEEIIKNYPEASNLMDIACQTLDFNLKDLCINGPAKELNKTENTQPAIYVISFILNKILQSKGIIPKLVAGHSLGEYTALAAAGVFSFTDGLELVRQRGILMSKGLTENSGGMAAVIGLDNKKIHTVCQQIDGVCEIANYNSPGQVVISGEKNVINRATQKLKDIGARKVIKLNVSGPFHSSLMLPAQKEFKKIIKGVTFNHPKYKFIPNVTANYTKDPENIKKLLIQQISQSVRWVETVNLMIKDGHKTFVEVGPGRILKGLLRRIDGSLTVYNVQKLTGLKKVIDKFSSESQEVK